MFWRRGEEEEEVGKEEVGAERARSKRKKSQCNSIDARSKLVIRFSLSLALSPSPVSSFITHECIWKPLQLSQRGRGDSGRPLIALDVRHWSVISDGSERGEVNVFFFSSLTFFVLKKRKKKNNVRDATLAPLATPPLDEASLLLCCSSSSSPASCRFSTECDRSRGQSGLPGADNQARHGRDRRPAAAIVVGVFSDVVEQTPTTAGWGRRRGHDLGRLAPSRRRVGSGQGVRRQRQKKRRWNNRGGSSSSSGVYRSEALGDRRGGRRRRRRRCWLLVPPTRGRNNDDLLRRRRRRGNPRRHPRRGSFLRGPPRRRRRGWAFKGKGTGMEHLSRGARGSGGRRGDLGRRRRRGRGRGVQPCAVCLWEKGRGAPGRFGRHHGRAESGERAVFFFFFPFFFLESRG